MTYGGRVWNGSEIEICDECGFDTRSVSSEGDAFAAVYGALAALVNDAERNDRRPEPETFSANEYLAHCLEVTEGLLGYIAEARGLLTPQVASLTQAVEEVDRLLAGLTPDERGLILSGKYPEPVSVDWMLTHLLHDMSHHVLDIRRGKARLALNDLPATWTTHRDRPL